MIVGGFPEKVEKGQFSFIHTSAIIIQHDIVFLTVFLRYAKNGGDYVCMFGSSQQDQIKSPHEENISLQVESFRQSEFTSPHFIRIHYAISPSNPLNWPIPPTFLLSSCRPFFLPCSFSFSSIIFFFFFFGWVVCVRIIIVIASWLNISVLIFWEDTGENWDGGATRSALYSREKNNITPPPHRPRRTQCMAFC